MTVETIFSKIINREIPAEIVLESQSCLAFRDINPQAPTHIVVIPKKHISQLSKAKEEDRDILGDLLLFAKQVASGLGLDSTGYRLVINNGEAAGQTVFHLHLHILAGRSLKWPPG